MGPPNHGPITNQQLPAQRLRFTQHSLHDNNGFRALIGLVLTLAFLLVVSLLWSAAITALQTWWAPWMQNVLWLIRVVDWIVSIAMTTVLVAAIYKWLPGVKIAWHEVLLGAHLTSVLLALGRTGISLYLTSTESTAGFGPVGYLAVTLLWVYYSAQIFLFGAEVARAVVVNRYEKRKV